MMHQHCRAHADICMSVRAISSTNNSSRSHQDAAASVGNVAPRRKDILHFYLYGTAPRQHQAFTLKRHAFEKLLMFHVSPHWARFISMTSSLHRRWTDGEGCLHIQTWRKCYPVARQEEGNTKKWQSTCYSDTAPGSNKVAF